MQVILDKEKLSEYVRAFEVIQTVPAPELQKIMKTNGEVVIKVKGASLDDHIRAQNLASAPSIFLSKIIKELREGKEVDVEAIQKKIFSEGEHPNTLLEISIFQRCVIEPQFTMQEVLEISEKLPEFVNRIAKLALHITSGDK